MLETQKRLTAQVSAWFARADARAQMTDRERKLFDALPDLVEQIE
jgi:hypothetical protein